jgi:hypothetical protein
LVFGFPRAIPKTAMQKYFNNIMTIFAAASAEHRPATFFGSGGTLFSMGFNSNPDASRFMKWYKVNKMQCRWKDPRGPGADRDEEPLFHNIIIKPPSTPEARARGKALAPYHAFLEEHLPAAGEFTFRTRPDKGTITVESDDDLWTIFSVLPDDPHNKVTTHAEALRAMGFTMDSITEFVKAFVPK